MLVTFPPHAHHRGRGRSAQWLALLMILVGRLRSAMPMEFLMDAQVAGYGRFVGVPSRSDLERFFVLDSVDRDLLGDRRGDHNRLGFMVQAATVRYIGVFLKDPVDVPWPVVEFVAEQLLNTIVGAYDRGGLSSLAMPIPGVPCGGSSASPPRRRSGTPRSDGARRPGIVGRSLTAGLVGNFVTARGESRPLATPAGLCRRWV